MNQPSEDPIRELQERQAEFERRIIDIERYISPLKFAQLEIESGRVFRKLDEIQDSVNTVNTQMEGARADVTVVKANHSEIKGYLENHGQRLESIEQKLESHDVLFAQLISVGEDHTKRFDQVDSSLAELKSTQQRQEQMLLEILKRLPEK